MRGDDLRASILNTLIVNQTQGLFPQPVQPCRNGPDKSALLRLARGRDVGGGIRIELGCGDKAGADGVLVDVGATGLEVGAIEDEVIGETALPDGELRAQATREAALDEIHRKRDCLVLRSDEQMDVVGHDDEGVEFVCALSTVVLQGFEEELGVARDLKETAAIVGNRGDEESAVAGGSRRDGHVASLVREW